MNIDDMTIGQARTLAGMFGAQQKNTGHIFDEFVGRYCICRASGAGVHAGVVKAIQPNNDGTNSVILSGARRLWKWKTISGVSLSGVATSGIDRAGSKIEAAITTHAIDGVCEIIPCSEAAKESINGA